jgi:DNA-directed RNA polymerase specialized sigma24 family protein
MQTMRVLPLRLHSLAPVRHDKSQSLALAGLHDFLLDTSWVRRRLARLAKQGPVPMSAADIAADAVMRIVRRMRSGFEPSNLEAYCSQTLRNTAIDALRARWREKHNSREVELLNDPVTHATPEDEYVAVETRARLERDLPPGIAANLRALLAGDELSTDQLYRVRRAVRELLRSAA